MLLITPLRPPVLNMLEMDPPPILPKMLGMLLLTGFNVLAMSVGNGCMPVISAGVADEP
jgi:hypothetical protein